MSIFDNDTKGKIISLEPGDQERINLIYKDLLDSILLLFAKDLKEPKGLVLVYNAILNVLKVFAKVLQFDEETMVGHVRMLCKIVDRKDPEENLEDKKKKIFN